VCVHAVVQCRQQLHMQHCSWDLAALRTALGVKISSSYPVGSKECVGDVLGQLCQQQGVPGTPEMAASAKAAAAATAAVATLNQRTVI
jgi:hypothetical protein